MRSFPSHEQLLAAMCFSLMNFMISLWLTLHSITLQT